MKYFLHLLVLFILPGFAINAESSLYHEIGMHFKIAFPQLEILLDDISEENIKKFDDCDDKKSQSKCMLDFLAGWIERDNKNKDLSLERFNAIIEEYNNLFKNFNEENFSNISKHINKKHELNQQDNEYQFVYRLILQSLEIIENATAGSYLFIQNTNYLPNAKLYSNVDSDFVKLRLKAVQITREVYGRILNRQERYNGLDEDLKSRLLLGLYAVLQGGSFRLLEKILQNRKDNKEQHKEICNVLQPFKIHIKNTLNEFEGQKEEMIRFCIENNIESEGVLSIFFDEKDRKKLLGIQAYQMPNDFLQLDIDQARMKYSDNNIINHLRLKYNDITINDMDTFITQLKSIFKALFLFLDDDKTKLILEIFFQNQKKEVIRDFIVKIDKDNVFPKKNIIKNNLFQKHFINDNVEEVFEYDALIPLFWEHLLVEKNELEIKKFLLLLKNQKKWENKYFVDFIQKFPDQKREFICDLFDQDEKKYEEILLKELFPRKNDYFSDSIDRLPHKITETEESYRELLMQIKSEKNEYLLNPLKIKANQYKCQLRSLYEIYINDFSYRYCLKSFDNKSFQDIFLRPCVDISRGEFRMLLGQDIKFNYVLRYLLLSEGDNRIKLINDFFSIIFQQGEEIFIKVVEEGVQSKADIDSIIYYCNKHASFSLFVRALPESLILSYCESIKNKAITKGQARFLILLLKNKKVSPAAKNKLANIFLEVSESNKNNLVQDSSWFDLLKDLIKDQDIDVNIQSSLLFFIIDEVIRCLGREYFGENVTRGFLYCELEKIIKDKNISLEIKNRRFDTVFNFIKKDLFQISLEKNECSLLLSILEAQDIDRTKKNELVDLIKNRLKREDNEISDYKYYFLLDIFNSKNSIDSEIKNDLSNAILYRLENKNNNFDLRGALSLGENKCSLIANILEDKNIDQKIKNKSVEVFFKKIKSFLISYGEYYLISEYRLLKNIVENKDIDASHKERVVECAFLKFKNGEKKGSLSDKKNLSWRLRNRYISLSKYILDIFLLKYIFESKNINSKIKNKLAFNIFLEFLKKDAVIDNKALSLISLILGSDVDNLMKFELGFLVLRLKENNKLQGINLEDYHSLKKINNKDDLYKNLGINNPGEPFKIKSELTIPNDPIRKSQIWSLMIQEPAIIQAPLSFGWKRVVANLYKVINKKKITMKDRTDQLKRILSPEFLKAIRLKRQNRAIKKDTIN